MTLRRHALVVHAASVHVWEPRACWQHALRILRSKQMWQFWIDVGGTFTDCLARSPDGKLKTVKTLSSGVTQGVVGALVEGGFRDPRRDDDPPGFWSGYAIRFFNGRGDPLHQSQVAAAEPELGILLVDPLPEAVDSGTRYALRRPATDAMDSQTS